jgi:NADPH-dependent glutamate synthase beta subunit-like oxidoreductase
VTREAKAMPKVSLFLPRSSSLTASNKTGYWSFIQPSYQEKTSPCSEACPCGTDIPRVEMLAADGRFAAAWRTILAENPLPGVCGRVCFHPCESACNRAELDEAVTVNALERFLSDTAQADGSAAGLAKRPAKGKKIAIVGSGPAGLSAAYFLSLLGYDCDILEAGDETGGVLRSGIPAYRLPAEALDRDIARIASLGVRIRTGAKADEDFLRDAGKSYAAVFVGCGHDKPMKLGAEGEAAAEDALAFLARVRKGTAAASGAKLPSAVIGGGNTAIDTARSLLRLGAEPVIVYRRRREDMPAFDKEVGEALAEGVRLMELCSPLSIDRGTEGYVLKLQRMKPADPGADGRMRVVPVPGEIAELRVAKVYAAIGAQASETWMLPSAEGSLSLGHCTIEWKGRGGIPFAYGGDLVNDTESVADAIASGKEAAIALDAYFAEGAEAVAGKIERCRIGKGSSLSMEIYSGGDRANRSSRVVKFSDINPDYFARSPRASAPSLAHALAVRSFTEVEGGLDTRAAVAQAERCFNCGICNGCDNCRTFCPEVAVLVDAEARSIDTDYCKGCGVCAAECPRNAMNMEEPQS